MSKYYKRKLSRKTSREYLKVYESVPESMPKIFKKSRLICFDKYVLTIRRGGTNSLNIQKHSLTDKESIDTEIKYVFEEISKEEFDEAIKIMEELQKIMKEKFKEIKE